ncbi:Calx-beta domain-containing protein [Paenibacillus chartarius]|uniref:Calx-beta domain-containing protein n=1 Tax=Paenibacillus chartarius TaxID=747481 RepID=A0ABV6DUC3_9BACL
MAVSTNISVWRTISLLLFFLCILLGLASVAKAESIVVASVPGTILDFDSNRILYVTDSSMVIRDRNTQQDSAMTPLEDSPFYYAGYLTNNGAIFHYWKKGLFLWKAGTEPEFIPNSNIGIFSKAKDGHFIPFTITTNNHIEAWLFNTLDNSFKNISEENHLYVRNSYSIRASKEGRLIYISEQGKVILYDNGLTTSLPIDAVDLRTISENLFVYLAQNPENNQYEYRSYNIQDKTSKFIISDGFDVSAFTYKGWTFYQDLNSAYRTSPATGKSEQFSGPRWFLFSIEGYSDTGEMIVYDLYEYTRFYINAKGEMKQIPESARTGVIYWNKSGKKWIGSSGSNIFELIPEPQEEIGKFRFDPKSQIIWANENTGTVTATVYRVGGSYGALTVDYSTFADTAKEHSDFIPAKGTLTFAEGETQKTIQIKLADDTIKENFESFSLLLTGLEERLDALHTNRAFFIIRDND